MKTATAVLLAIALTSGCSGGGDDTPTDAAVLIDSTAPSADATVTDGPAPDARVVDAAPVMPLGTVTAPEVMPPVSGTRLKLRWTESMEGEAAMVGLYDAMLQSSCSFTQASDGTLRCVPGVTVGSNDMRYEDPACTIPVYFISRASLLPAPAMNMMRFPADTVCPAGTAFHQLGAKLPNRMVYSNSSGACAPSTTAWPETGDFYRRGDEIPPATFVKGTPKPGTAVGNIAPLYLETEDGARIPRGYHDVAQGFDCNLARAADGNLRCLPSNIISARTTEFLDAACTMHAARGVKSGCAEAPFVSRVDPTCPARTGVYRGGAKQEMGFAMSSRGCAAITSAASFYPVGAEIPAESFAPGEEGLAPGTGHLRVRTTSTAAGAIRGSLYDTKLMAACSASRTVDGKTRCVPLEAYMFAGDFADALCTIPLAYGLGDACAEARYAYQPTPTGGRVLRVTAKHQGPTFSSADGVRCAQSNLVGATYLVGEEVPPSQLAEVRSVIR